MFAAAAAGAAGSLIGGLGAVAGQLGSTGMMVQGNYGLQAREQNFQLGLIESHKNALRSAGLPLHLAYGQGGGGYGLSARSYNPNSHITFGNGGYVPSTQYAVNQAFISTSNQNRMKGRAPIKVGGVTSTSSSA
uniref:VP2 n=1 Tax=Yancheng osbecks grenadier anchovy calicivirus TaxID=2116160 RepID=A0A2P1GNI2_9CALI|nr:VP2 [Yancheng osbecks grenadier anchovy calicivirus]